jgi:hypothetical protein
MSVPNLRPYLVPFLHPDLFGTYVLATLFSGAAGVAFAMGYGSVFRLGGFLFLAFLPIMIACWLLVLVMGSLQRWLWHRAAKPVPTGDNLRVMDLITYSFLVTASMLLAGIWFGAVFREFQAREVCRRVEPLLAMLRDEKNRSGMYPPNLRAFVKTNVPWRRDVLFYHGETNGVEWLPNHVASSDITLMAVSNRLECIVPIERMSPVSFSSFKIFVFTSDRQRWTRSRLHWSLLGAYIDPEKD